MIANKQKELREKLKDMLYILDGKVEDQSKLLLITSILFYRFLSEKIEDFDPNGDTLEKECIDKIGFYIEPNHRYDIFFNNAYEKGIDDFHFQLNLVFNIISHTMWVDEPHRVTTGFGLCSVFQIRYTVTDSHGIGYFYHELIECLTSYYGLSFKFKEAGFDVLGDAYEFLRSKFKNNAGKEHGEYYTPQSVAGLLSKIVTIDKQDKFSCYDPSCGSGSLLLNMANNTSAKKIYGQEINKQTQTIAKMSLFLTLDKTRNHIIACEDTLKNPEFIYNTGFDAVVSNPPYGLRWDGVDIFNSGCDFIPRRIMPPLENSEYAFILHSLEMLSTYGTAAIIVPHGVLYRSLIEKDIRKYLIDEKNYLDAVIGLPDRLFFGTKVETCVLVFKKNRIAKSVLFIDAKDEFTKQGRLKTLEKPAVLRIIKNLKDRKGSKKYSALVSHDELAKNDYNLNIRRYVDTMPGTMPGLSTFSEQTLFANMHKYSHDDNILNINDTTHEMKDKKIWLNVFKERYINWMFSTDTRYNSDGCFNWLNKRIDDVFTGKSSNGFTKQDIVKNGVNQCISYTELNVKYHEVIDPAINYIENRTNSENGIRSMAGDILISNVAQEGGGDRLTKSVLLNEENVLLGMHIVVLRAKIDIDPLFFAYYINNYMQRDLYRYIQGSTVLHLYFNHYKHLMMHIPESVEGQREVSNYLASIDEKIDWLEAKILSRQDKN